MGGLGGGGGVGGGWMMGGWVRIPPLQTAC